MDILLYAFIGICLAVVLIFMGAVLVSMLHKLYAKHKTRTDRKLLKDGAEDD